MMSDETTATDTGDNSAEGEVVQESLLGTVESVVEDSVLGASTSTDPADFSYVPEKFMNDGAPDFGKMAESYKALETKLHAGVPQDIADYRYDFPEGYEMAEESLTAFQTSAKEQGLSVDQYAFVMDNMTNAAQGLRETLGPNSRRDFETASNQLNDMWGDSVASNVQQAANVLGEFMPEGFDMKDFDNNAPVLALLHNISKHMGEDGTNLSNKTSVPNLTEEEVRQIMRDPEYGKQGPRAREMDAKVKAYFESMEG